MTSDSARPTAASGSGRRVNRLGIPILDRADDAFHRPRADHGFGRREPGEMPAIVKDRIAATTLCGAKAAAPRRAEDTRAPRENQNREDEAARRARHAKMSDREDTG